MYLLKMLSLPEVDWDADEVVYDYYHGYARLEKNNVVHMHHMALV